MAKFDLHQLLNERSKAAAVEREKEPRTADGMEQLTLDVYDLIPSQENFYSTQYINDLKQSIAIVGLLQPLLVERDGDKFRVVAGHAAAWPVWPWWKTAWNSSGACRA